MTCGRFRYNEERIFPATIRMNEKGGMRDVKFDSYIENSVIPLFPYLADGPGKRVLLKVTSRAVGIAVRDATAVT